MEIFVHRTFNAKAFERSFTTILDYANKLSSTEVDVHTLAMRSHTALFKSYFKIKSEQNHPADGCFDVTPLDRRLGAHGQTPPAGVQISRLSVQYSLGLSNIPIAPSECSPRRLLRPQPVTTLPPPPALPTPIPILCFESPSSFTAPI